MVDWWKLIIALNTGMLTVTITFLGQFGKSPKWPWLLILSWPCLVLSLAAATLKLWAYYAGPKGAEWWGEWIRNLAYTIGKTPNPSLIACLSFLLGLAFLLIFGAANVLRK
jgi:hypothetical protein